MRGLAGVARGGARGRPPENRACQTTAVRGGGQTCRCYYARAFSFTVRALNDEDRTYEQDVLWRLASKRYGKKGTHDA